MLNKRTTFAVTLGSILGVCAVVFSMFFFTFGANSAPPGINVALASNPVCSASSRTCLFVLDNVGQRCELTNVSLYLHGDTTVAQTMSDTPSGLISSQIFESAIKAHANQTVMVLFPNDTLKVGSTIYYEVYISNGSESIFGLANITP